jgi:predicted transposase/invertase (TIGR01784 family)
MSINNRYKDSVFSFLFSEPDKLRELYEAIEGVKLPADVRININTLEGVLFRTRLNDISFEVGERLVVLIEHQSSINPNMAIRLLMYIGRVYEKILGGKNIYGSKKLPIPRPKFIVLYNGVDPYPDHETIKLSDTFADMAGFDILDNKPPALELVVEVYNINEGHNADKLRRSRTLAGYSVFVAKVREFEAKAAAGRKVSELSDEERHEVMKQAIKWCIEHETLEEFLKTNGSEVINMLFDDWNLDTALKFEREYGREEGREYGREEGREEGHEKDARNALALGLSVDMVQKITGLDTQSIRRLAGQV